MGIYDKIFTYIEHNADLTTKIAEKYKNSLIFIGDEYQIWQPLTNTYVGVGLSNLDRISSATFSSKLFSTNTNNTYYITFSDVMDGFSISYTDQNLRYNPYYNKLTVNLFEGDLIGNSDTSSRLKGDNTYTAWGSIYWENGIPKSIEGEINNTYNIIPSENNTYTIGLEDKRYAYTYSYNFVGNLYGDVYGNSLTSSYANSSHISNSSYDIKISNTNDNRELYLTFAYNNEFSYVYVDQNLKYNPNTNTLQSNVFKGDLDGNAKTADKLGNNTYTAWGSIYIENGIAKSVEGEINNTYNVIPAEDNTYTLGLENKRYAYTYSNAFVGTLYGDIYGNSSSAAYSMSSYISNSSYTTKIIDTNENTELYITFAHNNDFSYAYVDQSLKYNPGTNILEANTFKGNLDGNAYSANRLKGDNSYTSWGQTFWENGVPKSIEGEINNTYNITPFEDNTYTLGITNKKYAYAYSTNFVGTLHGDVYGNSSTAIHSNSSNISNLSYTTRIINTNNNQELYITFAYNNDFSYSYVDQNLKYNANTNILEAGTFSGVLDPSLQWGVITGT